MTYTEREAIDRGGVVTSMDVTAVPNWVNDARPPAGWPSMVIRNTFVTGPVFWANTTNARCSEVLSGLAFPGDPTSRPAVRRAV